MAQVAIPAASPPIRSAFAAQTKNRIAAMSKSSAMTKTVEEQNQWMNKVHAAQNQRTPEALEAALQRAERARMQEVNVRKCKSVKGHAIRSQALAGEGLRQMAS